MVAEIFTFNTDTICNEHSKNIFGYAKCWVENKIDEKIEEIGLQKKYFENFDDHIENIWDDLIKNEYIDVEGNIMPKFSELEEIFRSKESKKRENLSKKEVAKILKIEYFTQICMDILNNIIRNNDLINDFKLHAHNNDLKINCIKDETLRNSLHHGAAFAIDEFKTRIGI